MEFSFSNSRWLTQYEISSEKNFGNKDALGFHIRDVEQDSGSQRMFLQEDPSNQIRLAVKKYAVENGLEFYDVKAQEGFLRTLMLRQNSKGEWMVLFQLYKEMESEEFDYLIIYYPNSLR
jgi:23S rRNA (uracil1939-C5)-methyltransferase